MKSARLLATISGFHMLNLRRCLHLETSSLRLFSVANFKCVDSERKRKEHTIIDKVRCGLTKARKSPVLS